MTPSPFLDPGHDHAHCASTAIADAERLCAARGVRLTPMRRSVLETLLSEHRPLGAYEIIERLAQKQAPPAPITVYRALDFLLENALAHRIASRNAFLGCVHNHAASEAVIFLICERCGAVGEAPAAGVHRSLDVAAAAAGFVPKQPVIEVSGLCAHCRQHAELPPAHTGA